MRALFFVGLLIFLQGCIGGAAVYYHEDPFMNPYDAENYGIEEEQKIIEEEYCGVRCGR